ncbi:hypothetical protein [Streptomyces altiplanensis]
MRPGIAVTAVSCAVLPTATDVLRHADSDGDQKAATVVRTHRGGTADLIALHPSAAEGGVTFSAASPRRSSPPAGAAPYGPPASPETP